ncbi:MAG TPA: DedA family protein [Bacteroidota bacterium]|nr:DedA family protein [Bacteroidota bacterium]
MESFLHNLSSFNPLWIYCIAAGVAYIENIFPPFPSDVVLVATASTIALGKVNFGILFIGSTVASTAGFITMYGVGKWFGARMVESRKIKFLPYEQIYIVEGWFKKYGYGIVVANRFLSGTRAVVSFFVGMSQLSLWKTILLSLVSSAAWNFLLIFAGKSLGDNWHHIQYYLEAYGKIITVVVVIAIVIYLSKWIYTNARQKKDK